jgi:hypothetical protein
MQSAAASDVRGAKESASPIHKFSRRSLIVQ